MMFSAARRHALFVRPLFLLALVALLYLGMLGEGRADRLRPDAPTGFSVTTGSGAPAAGCYAAGAATVDDDGAAWLCTDAGCPGTWVQVQTGVDAAVTAADVSLDPGELVYVSGVTVQEGVDDLDDAIGTVASSVTSHTGAATAAHAATAIAYTDTYELGTNDAQGAIDATVLLVGEHQDEAEGAHAASAISLDAIVGLVAMNAQAAIAEIYTLADAAASEAEGAGIDATQALADAATAQGTADAALPLSLATATDQYLRSTASATWGVRTTAETQGDLDILTLTAAAATTGAGLVGADDTGRSLITGSSVDAQLDDVDGTLVTMASDISTAQSTANAAAPSATLASTANGAGASLIGIEDSGGLITATTVEGALAELAGASSSTAPGPVVLQWGGTNISGNFVSANAGVNASIVSFTFDKSDVSGFANLTYEAAVRSSNSLVTCSLDIVELGKKGDTADSTIASVSLDGATIFDGTYPTLITGTIALSGFTAGLEEYALKLNNSASNICYIRAATLRLAP